MKPTDKVDDLLTKAGAQWRASQPSAPEPDLDRITSAQRKRRWLVPTLAAASVAAIATAALIVLPDRTEPAVAPPPSAPKVMQGEPRSVQPTAAQPGADGLLVRDGDKVEINGQIVAVPGKDPVFCPDVIRTLPGYPPGKEPPPYCGDDQSVKLIGLDLAKLSEPKLTQGVRSGFGHVVGTWRAKTITVEEQAAYRKLPGSEPAEQMSCPPPAGGWQSRPSNLDSKPVQDFLTSKADVISGQRVSYPAGHSRKAPVVFSVGVAKGDLAAFRKALETVYKGNLCVFRGKISLAENTQITEALSTLMGERKDLSIFHGGGSRGDEGLVPVHLLVFDDKAKAALTPLGLEKLDITPSVRPIR
ncbi:hypothetical protein [Kribbella sp. CA-294648]|uniref:hypothetical protein n=1 Tax=Kribbella sp. CA-294648 TaxID=3239948 RepID=UPI003D8D9DC0